MKYDNIPTGKYKTNADIGVPSKRFFVSEVEKYCYMWKEGENFQKKNIKLINNYRLNNFKLTEFSFSINSCSSSLL